MKTFTTLALAASLATVFAGAGFAQSSMSNMSASDKAMMDKCKGMSDSAMKADKGCMDMMKKNGMASPADQNANPTPKSK